MRPKTPSSAKAPPHISMRGRGPLPRWAAKDAVQAGFILLVLLNIFFFPFIWGNKTLLLSARHAASIVPGGAASDAPPLKLGRTSDAGGPGWYFEPSLQVTRRAYVE